MNDTHTDLSQKGVIRSPKLKGRAKVVYLFKKYKRTAAIAASIAGITALTISALVSSFSSSGKINEEVKDDVAMLRRDLNTLRKNDDILNTKIEKVKDNAVISAPIEYTSGGTGFLIDAQGYIVTNSHIVDKARYVAVQNSEGKEFTATIAYTDVLHDIAILKINDTSFKSGSIPYSLKKNSANISESIYTLGYPRNDIVYGEGYVAAKTGYNGDSLTLQITVAANQGNSGGPVLNRNGEVVGVITGKQTTIEGAVFAIQSKYIQQALYKLQQDSTHKDIKIPSASNLKNLDRTQQVEKITRYVYMVKVN